MRTERRRAAWLGGLAVAISVLAMVVFAAPALGAFGISESSLGFTDAEGTASLQAGSHPYAMTTTIAVNTKPAEGGLVLPDEEPKDVAIRFSPGIVGNPKPVPTCSDAAFATINLKNPFSACPASSAVGTAEIAAAFGAGPANLEAFFALTRENGESPVPVYNLEPPPGVASKLGFVVLSTSPVIVETRLNPNPPYNLVSEATYISDIVQFYGARVTLWGNPADPDHDSERGRCAISSDLCKSDLPVIPFLTLPTACEGPLQAEFAADSWQNPGKWTTPVTAVTEEGGEAVSMRDCESVRFDPQVDSKPTSAAAESPTGLQFNIGFDNEGLVKPEGRAQSTMRKVVVTLPQGVTANPSVAGGLATCTQSQLALESLTSPPGAGCPQASKIGDVEVETPLLEGKLLRGDVFLATQGENPFGTLLALYIVIREPRLGIFVKLAGKVEPHPVTGQLVTTFGEAPYEIPQVPFSKFRFRFREGARSPLVTPPVCGTFLTTVQFTPSSGGEAVTATSPFSITAGPNGQGCPAAGVPPFSPGFEAGSISNQAGSYSPFYMRLSRADGEQDITRFGATLAPGVVGKIAGIAQCPQSAIEAAKSKAGRAELASPSCPAASQIGRTQSGAGVGPLLTYVPGSLYLAGPYGGAPLSVAAIVPAVAGPFDVGTVVVQEALRLNPNTGQVEVDGGASDPIPRMLAGIPLKLRDLRVYADRSNFTLNPTSCAPMATNATLFGSGANPLSPIDDAPVDVRARFQAAGCASLGFRPRLSLQLKGGVRRSANTSLRATLRPRKGDANLKGAVVVLPPSQFIDNAHISNPCTRDQFNARKCPARSVLGTARAFTPLLDDPLEGKVYFRSNGGARDLPDVVAALRGQFEFNLVIAILTAKNGRVRTKVLNAPDAPVTRFVLKMSGGKKGLLENSENLCRRPQRVKLVLSGQNGRELRSQPSIETDCRSGKK